MDVVYIVGPGRRPWLRWSLRSLANLAHDRVWIAGAITEGLRDISHIPVPQEGPPNANSTANVVAACEHPEVSDPFLLFNDDFFVLEPVDRMPVLHNGPVESGISTPHLNRWHRGRIDTRRLMVEWGIEEALSYELHVPLPVGKGVMADVIRRAQPAGIEALHKRTLYGNVAELGGTYARDPKIHNPLGRWKPGDRFVSTSTSSWDATAGEELRARFCDPSPYEISKKGRPMSNETITIDELTRVREFDKASGRTVIRVFRPGEKVDRKRAQKLGIVAKGKGSKKAKAEKVNDGTVKALLAKVGDDAEAAAAVIEAEKAEKEPRTSLIEGLEAVLEAAAGGADDAGGGD